MLDNNLKVVVDKAKILTEALPFIRDFHNKIFVIKYGSSVLGNKEVTENVMNDIAMLKLTGMKPVIVHSGSDEITRWAKNIGKSIEYLEGNRVTDKETMEIVEMVLGKINKDLVQLLEKNGVHCVGICGKDNETIKVEKKIVKNGDIGYFGKIQEINSELIHKLIDNDYVPVIASIGINDDYESYNLNADDVATEVAKALNAEKLIFLAKESGILLNPEDKNSLSYFLSTEKAEKLIKDNLVDENILSKLKCAIDAAENGVNRVHIIDGACKHSMLLEFFTKQGIGTAVGHNLKEIH